MIKHTRIENKIRRHYVERGYSPSTVDQIIDFWRTFIAWLNLQFIDYKKASKADLLAFQNQLLEKKKATVVRNTISGIKNCYDALISQNVVKANPALVTPVLAKSDYKEPLPLNKEELEKMYRSYPEDNDIRIREKVILGLMVFQGIDSRSVNNLKVNDLDLVGGVINVPGSKKENKRTLRLDYFQYDCLKKYIEILPILQKKHKGSDKLILTTKGSINVQNILTQLKKRVKKIEPKLRNLSHIRNSVIKNWCVEYEGNLPKIQYMAGHKYISSTERYTRKNIEDLKKKVNQFFPFSFS